MDRTEKKIINPVKGSRRHGNKKVRIVVSFEPETFDEVSNMAFNRNISMGQQIRVLVERGILAQEDYEDG